MLRRAHILCLCLALALTAFAAERKAVPALDEPLDPNVATLQQLMRVPGITRVWAERILRFRPYTNKGQLKSQGILPATVYEQAAPSLVVHRKPRE